MSRSPPWLPGLISSKDDCRPKNGGPPGYDEWRIEALGPDALQDLDTMA
ncbi:hypothetical protein [Mesorhizobium sp. M0478]